MKFDPKALLEKLGWAEGTGLGKKNQGITEPIKAKIKFDKKGLGNNGGENFSFQWWDHAYNTAAKKLRVVASEDGGVKVECDGDETVLSTKKGIIISPYTSGNYSNFIKNATLSDGVTVEFPESSNDSDSDAASDLGTASKFTDEELFAKCKGLTAHKGARHGIYLSGKLQRIKQQEELAMKSLNYITAPSAAVLESTVSEVRDECIKKKKSKKRKCEDDLSKIETEECAAECIVACDESEPGPKKKKCKTVHAERLEIDNSETITQKDEDVIPRKKKNKKSKQEKFGSEDVSADVNADLAEVISENVVKIKRRKTKNIPENESRNNEENNYANQEIGKSYEEPVTDACSKKKRKIKKEEADSLVNVDLSVDDNDQAKVKETKKKSKKKKLNEVDTESEMNQCSRRVAENKDLLDEDSSTERKMKTERNAKKIINKSLGDGSFDCVTRSDQTKIDSDAEANLDEHRSEKKAKKSRACGSEETTSRSVSKETLEENDESATTVRSKRSKKSCETSSRKSASSEPIEENGDGADSSTRKKNGGVAEEEDVKSSGGGEIAKVGKRKKIKKEKS